MDLVELRPAVLLSDDELVVALDAVHATRAQLDSYELQLVARLHETGYAEGAGDHDTVRFLADRYRFDTSVARRKVDLAAALHKYPAVAAALPDPFAATSPDGTVQYCEPSADSAPCGCGRSGDDVPCVCGGSDAADGGDCERGCGGSGCSAGVLPVLLHVDQARVIVEALERIPARAMVPVEDLRVAEEELVKAGRHLSPGDLRKLGSQVRDRLDTDGSEPAEDKARQREALKMTNAEGGVKFNGFLAAENAELFTGAILAGSKPHKTVDGGSDPRSREKRQADALTGVLHAAAATGDLPANGGVKPHITVTMDLDDLINAGKHATGDLTYGTGLSASAVRMLACDAGIIPMVLGSDSQPLDVGREERFVTGPIRTALVHRDKGCVVCGAPPIFCDAHHLIHWIDGGPTSLSNLVLLCRVHHIAVHQGHWTVTITDNLVDVTRPHWTEPSRRTLFSPPANRPPSPPPGPTSTAAAEACTDPLDHSDPSTPDPAETPHPAQAWPPTCDTCPPTPPEAAPAPGAAVTPRPARAWPLTGDTRRRNPDAITNFNPWADDPPAPTPNRDAPLNPWTDETAPPPPDEAAHLDPWAEETPVPTPGGSHPFSPRGVETAQLPPGEAVRLDPWGEEPPVPTPREGTPFTSWGDEADVAVPHAVAPLNPWGDPSIASTG
ncbi:DUF222 domain-containing protein [Kribbella sp. NPDC006257]|uniref:HNH endonuclease signature motif containing protein n=1 Tax=Kribbella sp. NPDC006257 TaxID=3156738 RepID=UPI0033A80615